MKKNEIATATNNTITFAGVSISDYAGKLGFDMLHTERESDGKVAVSVYDKDGKEVGVNLENISDDNLNSLNFVQSISNLNEVSPVMLAWHIYQLRDFANHCGFGSVGAFIAEQLHGRMKPNYANQLANVAEKFLEIKDGDTLPTFKYSWCNKVPVSNLALILGEFNKCGDEPTFRERFIDCDNPLTLRNQNKLKEELKEVRGTTSKPKKSDNDEQGEQGEQGESVKTISIATALSMAYEYITTHEKPMRDMGLEDVHIQMISGILKTYMESVTE